MTMSDSGAAPRRDVGTTEGGARYARRLAPASTMTLDDLVAALAAVLPERHARAAVSRARRVADVREQGVLEAHALIMVLESIASEGGALQVLAEDLARRALDWPGAPGE